MREDADRGVAVDVAVEHMADAPVSGLAGNEFIPPGNQTTMSILNRRKRFGRFMKIFTNHFCVHSRFWVGPSCGVSLD